LLNSPLASSDPLAADIYCCSGIDCCGGGTGPTSNPASRLKYGYAISGSSKALSSGQSRQASSNDNHLERLLSARHLNEQRLLEESQHS